MKVFTSSFKERRLKQKQKKKKKVAHRVESSVKRQPMTHTSNGMTTARFKTTYDILRRTPFAVCERTKPSGAANHATANQLLQHTRRGQTGFLTGKGGETNVHLQPTTADGATVYDLI